jgi:DTW domain-containing protein YfiP
MLLISLVFNILKKSKANQPQHMQKVHSHFGNFAHISVLSPDCVNIHEVTLFRFKNNTNQYPNIPDYESIRDEVVLLFPSPKAEYIENMDFTKVKRLVVVDSTWQTTNQILRDPKFENVRHCKIKPHKTLFWRYQCISEEFVSTVEATYYFVKEYHQAMFKEETQKYDNLLWLFLYIYHKIQESYKSDTNKVYTTRKVGDYIKYNKEQ